jgi:hypothetical protein
MSIKTLAVCLLLSNASLSNAQILGGGPDFANATLFSQSWLNACPSGATVFSNDAAFEPTIAIDPCAPPPACVTGTAISDVWFRFFAQSAAVKIVINPDPSFNIGLQAFSGSTCPGLTDIGCVDAGGIGGTET